MVDRIGQQLGNYRLIQLLGQGAFASVYLGKHIFLETDAAIKVLHTQLVSDDIEPFRIEARTIAHLIHPHIVRVLEFGVEDTTPFLVMDYAPNGTLRRRHPKGTKLPVSIVVDYVKQIAPALQYAHEQKLIHRDIKPENLLIGRANDILISDFGIALVAQSSRYQSTRDMAGTIAYMAPEQIQAHPRPASDQYALGIVTYEWLSGDRPFQGSFTEIAIKHSLIPPPPLREKIPTLSPAIEQVVMTALEKDPKQRFATVQAFAHALEQASHVSSDKNIQAKLPLQPPVETNFISEPKAATNLVTSLERPLTPTELSIPPGKTPTPTRMTTSSNPSTAPYEKTPPKQTQQPSSNIEPPGTEVTRVNLVPLGLGAFAITIFALGFLNASFASGASIINGLVILFSASGIIQLIVGIQALRSSNNLATTAFCSYGGFWLALAFTISPTTRIFAYIPATDIHIAIGFFFLGWTIFTGLMLLSALKKNRALLTIFIPLFLAFLSLTAGEMGPSSSLDMVGGYIELVTGLMTVGLVWYTATHRSTSVAVIKANPTSLGMSAFAFTTFAVSVSNAGFFNGIAIIIGPALFYGGLVQIIAGVQALRTNNTFGATFFCSNGGIWLAFGYAFWQNLLNLTTVSYFLIGWTIINFVAFIVAWKTNRAFIALSFVTFLTFFALSIGEMGSAASISRIGGWLGILSALIAWYIALAFLLSEAQGPFLLPVGLRS